MILFDIACILKSWYVPRFLITYIFPFIFLNISNLVSSICYLFLLRGILLKIGIAIVPSVCCPSNKRSQGKHNICASYIESVISRLRSNISLYLKDIELIFPTIMHLPIVIHILIIMYFAILKIQKKKCFNEPLLIKDFGQFLYSYYLTICEITK